MAWGKAKTDDLASKLSSGVDSLFVLGFRPFGPDAAVTFAAALKGNTTLKEFYASGKAIGVKGAEAFADALATNTTLTALCVGNKEFGDEAVTALCAGVAKNSGLQKLDLQEKGLSSASIPSIKAVLENHPTLTWLSLSKNNLTPDDVAALMEGLAGHGAPVLSHLDLSHTKLDAMPVPGLGPVLASPVCSLRHLDLSNNDLHDSVAPHLASAVGLTSLRLTSCGLTPAFVDALCAVEASAPPRRWQSLHLDENPGVGPSGASSVASLLATAGDAASSGTGTGTGAGAGAGAGASTASASDSATPRVPSLHAPDLATVSFQNCNVGDEGVAALCSSLQSAAASMTRLDLAGNAITAAGAESLGSVVRDLQSVRLFNNTVGDDGAAVLLRAALTPSESDGARSGLAVLDLGANNLTDSVVYDMRPLLSTPPPAGAGISLRTLELFANKLTDAADEMLAELKELPHVDIDIAWRGPGDKGGGDGDDGGPAGMAAAGSGSGSGSSGGGAGVGAGSGAGIGMGPFSRAK